MPPTSEELLDGDGSLELCKCSKFDDSNPSIACSLFKLFRLLVEFADDDAWWCNWGGAGSPEEDVILLVEDRLRGPSTAPGEVDGEGADSAMWWSRRFSWIDILIIEAQFFVVAKGLETDLRTTEGFHIKHYCTVMYNTLSIEYSTIKLILNR